MKRMSMGILVALLASAAFAQTAGQPSAGPQAWGSMPAVTAPTFTTVSGTLAFVDDQPAIKTSDGKTILLAMPRFYYYAYTEGFKAGMPIKAQGGLVLYPEGTSQAGQSVLMADEVTIGGKTYVTVGGGRGMGPGRAMGMPGYGYSGAGPGTGWGPGRR